MNKTDLLAIVAKNLGPDTTKAAAERALAAVTDAIIEGVKKDDSVQLIGFGTFKKTARAARKGINPATQKPIQIKASTSVKFKLGAEFKNAVAGKKPAKK